MFYGTVAELDIESKRIIQGVDAFARGYAIAYGLSYIERIQNPMMLNNPITDDFPQEDNSTSLTVKAQILLLHELGFFDCESVKTLTTKAQGELVASLLGNSVKNTTEMIRGRLGKAVDSRYDIHSKESVAAVTALLNVLSSKKEKK